MSFRVIFTVLVTRFGLVEQILRVPWRDIAVVPLWVIFLSLGLFRLLLVGPFTVSENLIKAIKEVKVIVLI